MTPRRARHAGDAVRADVRARRDGRQLDTRVPPNNYWRRQHDWNDAPATLTGARQKNMAEVLSRRRRNGTPAAAATRARTRAARPRDHAADRRHAPPDCHAVKAAIDAMAPDGTTNVPEGMAWGWRVVSQRRALHRGRPETEKGNDKVVIVLTDGANTYYTPGWLRHAGNKSTYSSYGYTGQWPTMHTSTRGCSRTPTRHQDRLFERQLHQGAERAVRPRSAPMPRRPRSWS